MANLQAVSSQSKHQEEAVKVLEYLWTNKAAFELLVWGIEGKHYTRLEDGRIQPDQSGGYYTNIPWVFGNTFHSVIAPAPLDGPAKTKELNANAFKPHIMGFTPNMDEIKTEVAAVSAVLDQYDAAVQSGYTDPETELPEYIDALKQAGIDDLIAKLQAQIDAWKAGQ